MARELPNFCGGASPWFHLHRGLSFADAIDGACDVRLGHDRRRAANAEPAAGVDHQDAAVGVLEDVGRMEVPVVGGEEILGLANEACALAFEDVPLDAMTIELTEETSGHLTGKFLTPVPIEFSRASFDPKTHAVALEAMDQKSGKRYRIDGKIRGTELKGNLEINDVKGDLLLIKWIYFPR